MRTTFLRLVPLAAGVVLCMVFVDRPLAVWLHRQFYGTAVYAAAETLFRIADGLGLAGGIAVLAIWIARLTGASVARPIQRFAVAGTGAILALAVAVLSKLAIGRSQVYPPFLRDGVYGFAPFSGSTGYAAFPSATMAVACAFFAGFGAAGRAGRLTAGLVLTMLAAALLATNGHWLSDLAGGACVGVVVGVRIRKNARSERLEAGRPVAALRQQM